MRVETEARVSITAGSSEMERERWWERVSIPGMMVSKTLDMVVGFVAAEAPRDGVAVVVRVPR